MNPVVSFNAHQMHFRELFIWESYYWRLHKSTTFSFTLFLFLYNYYSKANCISGDLWVHYSILEVAHPFCATQPNRSLINYFGHLSLVNCQSANRSASSSPARLRRTGIFRMRWHCAYLKLHLCCHFLFFSLLFFNRHNTRANGKAKRAQLQVAHSKHIPHPRQHASCVCCSQHSPWFPLLIFILCLFLSLFSKFLLVCLHYRVAEVALLLLLIPRKLTLQLRSCCWRHCACRLVCQVASVATALWVRWLLQLLRGLVLCTSAAAPFGCARALGRCCCGCGCGCWRLVLVSLSVSHCCNAMNFIWIFSHSFFFANSIL